MTETSRKIKPNRILLPGLVVVALLSGVCLVAQAQSSVGIDFTGAIKARFPGKVQFECLASSTVDVPAGTMLSSPPAFMTPVATDTVVRVSGHSIRFFPGAVMAVDDGVVRPITGRFHFHSEVASFPIKVAARRYAAEYSSGNFWLEVTADNGTFMAMAGKGEIWFKDESRRVIELEPSQEIHVPLFGETVVTERLTGRWELPPEGFAVAETDLNKQTSQEPDVQTSEEIASDSVDIDKAPDDGTVADIPDSAEIIQPD